MASITSPVPGYLIEVRPATDVFGPGFLTVSHGSVAAVLSGNAGLGQVLSANTDVEFGGTKFYQWLRNAAPITGATSSTYTQVTADLGTVLTCQVSGLVYVTAGLSVPAAIAAPPVTPTGSGNDISQVLPTAGLTDSSIIVNYGNYLSLGSVSLPDGDWTIHVATQLVSGGWTNDFLAFSMGPTVANSMGAPGSLTIAYPQSSNDPFCAAWTVAARDDAGTRISQRTPTAWLGGANGSPSVLSGPRYVKNTTDALTRNVFVQRKGNALSIWTVEPGCTARKSQEVTSSFGAIADKPAYLGAFPTANTPDAARNNGGLKLGRFFKVAVALSPRQMEAVASGVDPRALVTFDAAKKDLLFPMPAGAATGATCADLIQGQVATFQAAAVNGGALMPATPLVDQARVEISGGKVFQASGASSTLTLNGTYTGADGTIEVKLTDYTTTSTIVQDWTQIAMGAGGAWSGSLSGIPRGLQWFDIQIRKRVAGALVGPAVTTRKKFTVGIGVELLGQSLMEYMRTSGTAQATGAATNYVSFYSRARADNGAIQGQYVTGWNQNSTEGFGDVKLAQSIGNVMNAPVGVMVDAVQGTPIAQWLEPNSAHLTNALLTLQENKPRHIFWNQGHGSVADGYDSYKASLTALYGKLKAAITWDWVFHILPLNNNFDPIQSPGLFFDIRRAQVDWVTEQRTAGETRVVLAGSVNDTTLQDGIHATSDNAGFGRFAERMAQSVLFAEGAVPLSAIGPCINGVTMSGAVATVAFAHNGGTALQTPAAGDVTGFELSLDNFATKLAISSAVISGANTVAITLDAVPATLPKLRYQWGKPGTGTTAATTGIANPLYDNRSPLINTALGYPAMFTTMPWQAV